jgi:hypothetical protein
VQRSKKFAAIAVGIKLTLSGVQVGVFSHLRKKGLAGRSVSNYFVQCGINRR